MIHELPFNVAKPNTKDLDQELENTIKWLILVVGQNFELVWQLIQ